MSKNLTLIINLKPDAEAQALAEFVKGGFRLESWKALEDVGTVYSARIFPLPHPDRVAGVDPPLYSTIVLATDYEGRPDIYQKAFWERLAPFFLLVAFSVKNPPFEKTDLTAEQLKAFQACQIVILKSKTDATDEDFDKTQKAFKATTEALALALREDETRKQNGEIAKTKFELFTQWVNDNNLGFPAGSPRGPDGSMPGKDLRLPPVGNERSQFMHKWLPHPPFPEVKLP